MCALELVLRADSDDAFAFGCDGRVREDAGVVQLGCAAGARGAGAGDDLGRVDEESLRWHLSRIYVAKSDGGWAQQRRRVRGLNNGDG